MPKVALEIRIPQLIIDKRSGIPLYQQLYEALRSVILQGSLRPGQRLPAARRLAEDLKLSRNIVSKAFEQLTIEGYLKSAVGSGTYVNDNLPDSFIQPTQLQAEPSPLIGNTKTSEEFLHSTPFLLARNTGKESIRPFQNAVPAMDVFPYKIWSSIATKLYQRMENLPLGYENAAGYQPLREAIAAYVRAFRGVKCESDQVIIVNGTQQALTILSSVLIKENDEVLVEDPGYSGAKVAFAYAKAKVCPVPVEHDGMDVNYAIQHYKNAKCAYITPAHQYPLGGTLSMSKRLQLLEWAKKLRVWIIEDDYDSELRYASEPLAALQGIDQHGRVIYIGSFSKIVYPGLRLAYVVLPTKQMADYFARLKAIFDRQTPIMEQAILTEFITQGHFYRHLRKMRLVYAERQRLLLKAISKEVSEFMFAEPHEAGMHLVAWLRDGYNDKTVAAILEKEGIIANPLSEYVIEFKCAPALILGYAAFNKFKLRHNVIRMGQILSKVKT